MHIVSGRSSRRASRPTQRFEQDQRSEHEGADHPLDFADSVSRRRPSIYCSGQPV
jgi:hypothetical protein